MNNGSTDDDAGNPTGGHAVRVIGCGKQNGVPWIKYVHDARQADIDPNDELGLETVQAFVADIDGDGMLNLESINIELRFAHSESVTEALAMGPEAPPQTFREAIGNGASFLANALTRGVIATVFGIFNGITFNQANAEATVRPVRPPRSSLELPTTMNGATVLVNNRPAPLYAAGPGQINFQIPYETEPGEASVVVEINGRRSATWSVPIGVAGPGIFILPESIAGPGRAIAQNLDFSLNVPDNPVLPGGLIIVYVTGLGEVTNPVATGEQAPLGPLSEAVGLVTATIGGMEATVQFAGLTPNSIGLAQVNLFVPELPPGDHAVVITVSGVDSNSLLIAVGEN